MLPLTMTLLLFNFCGMFVCGSLALDTSNGKKLAQLALASLFVGFIMWPVWGAYLLIKKAFGGDE